MQNLKEFRMPEGFRGRSAFYVQLWWLVQATFFRFSPQVMYGWRRFLLRLFGAKIGRNVLIRPTAQFTYPWKVEIGDYSWVGDMVHFYSLGEIKVGKNSVISQGVYLCAGTHDYNVRSFPIKSKNIEVCDMCWVATDVYVAPGVKIHNGCVVGARSSVFSDLPENSVCVGYPAKKIKNRIKEDLMI